MCSCTVSLHPPGCSELLAASWGWRNVSCNKTPKNSDTRKKCCKYPKIGTVSFYYRVIGPKDADEIANSVDPGQTAPLGKLRIIMVYWHCVIC